MDDIGASIGFVVGNSFNLGGGRAVVFLGRLANGRRPGKVVVVSQRCSGHRRHGRHASAAGSLLYSSFGRRFPPLEPAGADRRLVPISAWALAGGSGGPIWLGLAGQHDGGVELCGIQKSGLPAARLSRGRAFPRLRR